MFQHICGIDFRFLIGLLWNLCKKIKSKDCLSVIYFLALYFLFLWSICGFLYRCHSVSITVALELLKSCIIVVHFLCFSPKIALDILVLWIAVFSLESGDQFLPLPKKILWDCDRDCTEDIECFIGGLTTALNFTIQSSLIWVFFHFPWKCLHFPVYKSSVSC